MNPVAAVLITLAGVALTWAVLSRSHAGRLEELARVAPFLEVLAMFKVVMVESDSARAEEMERDFGTSAQVTRLAEWDEARDYLERGSGASPSLIVLQLRLQTPDDLDVLSWLRRHPRLKHVPVVVLASHKDGDEFERALELGANDCRCRPPDREGLRRVVRAPARFWALNEAPF